MFFFPLHQIPLHLGYFDGGLLHFRWKIPLCLFPALSGSHSPTANRCQSSFLPFLSFPLQLCPTFSSQLSPSWQLVASCSWLLTCRYWEDTHLHSHLRYVKPVCDVSMCSLCSITWRYSIKDTWLTTTGLTHPMTHCWGKPTDKHSCTAWCSRWKCSGLSLGHNYTADTDKRQGALPSVDFCWLWGFHQNKLMILWGVITQSPLGVGEVECSCDTKITSSLSQAIQRSQNFKKLQCNTNLS